MPAKFFSLALVLSIFTGFPHCWAANPDRQLGEAVDRGDLEDIRDAIAAGASLKGVLSRAVGGPTNMTQVVELLLDKGADVNEREGNGLPPLFRILRDDRGESLARKFVAAKPDLKVTNSEGETVLILACARGWTILATELLAQGAEPNTANKKGMTALMILASELHQDAYRQEDYIALAKALLAAGADINRKNLDGKTAVELALERENFDLLQLLDQESKYKERYDRLKKAELNRKLASSIQRHNYDRERLVGIPPLPAFDSVSATDRFLKEGADPNGILPDLKTSMLGLALCGGDYWGDPDPLVIKRLLDAGADPNHKYDDEEWPLHTAVKKYEIFKMLLEKGAKPDVLSKKTGFALIHSAAAEGDSATMNFILAHGGKIEERTQDGAYTPLLLALKNGNSETASVLLKKGANTSAKTSNGQSTADLAALVYDISLLHELDKDKKHADLLKDFSPPHNSPMAGKWVHGTGKEELLLTLAADGGGSFAGRPLAWKEGSDGFLLVTTENPDEESPQPRSYECTMKYDATSNTICMIAPSGSGSKMIFARPGAKSDPFPPSPGKTELQPDITEKIAKVRLSEEQFLDLTEGDLTSIPEAVFGLIGLRGLSLQNTKIDRLPERLKELQLLTRITGHNNQIATVDPGVFELTNLEEFHVGSRLKTLSPQVTRLKKLKELGLRDNRLENLPEASWKSMTELLSVDVSGNRLKVVPVSLADAPKLKVLSLSENLLTILPEELGRATHLETLRLEVNRFKEFPKVLCNLISLEYLSIGRNEIKTLPAEISKLSRLKRLQLENCQFTQFPIEVKGLKLEELVLRNNQIKSFPLTPDTIPATLKILDLGGNQITEVPDWVFNLKLHRLDLRGNPMTDEKLREIEKKIMDLAEQDRNAKKVKP